MRRKPSRLSTGRLKLLRLFSTLLPITLNLLDRRDYFRNRNPSTRSKKKRPRVNMRGPRSVNSLAPYVTSAADGVYRG